MKIRRSPIILLSFCFLFFGYGCQKHPSYNLSYREGSFCARVEGNQFGLDFCCDIYCEGGALSKIVYSSPATLENVTVRPSQNGGYEIQKDGLFGSFLRNSSAVHGLLLPADRLLLNGFDPSFVNSVQKISNGFILSISLPNEDQPISLSLTEDGLPTVLSGPDFSYRIRFH